MSSSPTKIDQYGTNFNQIFVPELKSKSVKKIILKSISESSVVPGTKSMKNVLLDLVQEPSKSTFSRMNELKTIHERSQQFIKDLTESKMEFIIGKYFEFCGFDDVDSIVTDLPETVENYEIKEFLSQKLKEAFLEDIFSISVEGNSEKTMTEELNKIIKILLEH